MSTPTDSRDQLPIEGDESFGEMLSAYERTNARVATADNRLIGTVVAISADTVFVDIGYKTEGILPMSLFAGEKEQVKIGDKLPVSSKGRNLEGYYELSRLHIEQPKDWSALEHAFANQSVITGTVTAAVRGGLTVDIGVRAFMPASRSRVRESADIASLVGQEIRCRITKLDAATEDVVVDRRIVSEEDEHALRDNRYGEINFGDVVNGTVRSLTDFGAFVDLGGVDGLLHIGEIAWTRVTKAEDVLSVGQEIEVKVIKVDEETRRISLSLKQLQRHPWETVTDRYKIGDRVRGRVARVADFGVFLEIEPGVEGLIHVSEMSWGKKVRKASDMLKVDDIADAIVLRINANEHRLSLGLKQTLGDPWVEMAERLSPGSVVDGEVSSFTSFGAFVLLSVGVQGLIHISEIAPDRRLNHPSDVLRIGEHVKAKVLDFNQEKRQLRLSLKQMVPTGLEEFLSDHRVGDRVSGRVLNGDGSQVGVELGEGIVASCRSQRAEIESRHYSETKPDLSSLGSMLNARWKMGEGASEAKVRSVAPGQVRAFKITGLDQESASIELDFAD